MSIWRVRLCRMTYEDIFLEWTISQGLDFTASLEFKYDVSVVVTFVLSRVFLSCFFPFCGEYRPQHVNAAVFFLDIFSHNALALRARYDSNKHLAKIVCVVVKTGFVIVRVPARHAQNREGMKLFWRGDGAIHTELFGNKLVNGD